VASAIVIVAKKIVIASPPRFERAGRGDRVHQGFVRALVASDSPSRKTTTSASAFIKVMWPSSRAAISALRTLRDRRRA
jgi:hypothetical protein